MRFVAEVSERARSAASGFLASSEYGADSLFDNDYPRGFSYHLCYAKQPTKQFTKQCARNA